MARLIYLRTLRGGGRRAPGRAFQGRARAL